MKNKQPSEGLGQRMKFFLTFATAAAVTQLVSTGIVRGDLPQYNAHCIVSGDVGYDNDAQSGVVPVDAAAISEDSNGRGEARVVDSDKMEHLHLSISGAGSGVGTVTESSGAFFVERKYHHSQQGNHHRAEWMSSIAVDVSWESAGQIWVGERNGAWKFYWVEQKTLNGGILLMKVNMTGEGTVNVWRRIPGAEPAYTVNLNNDQIYEVLGIESEGGISHTNSGYIRVEFDSRTDSLTENDSGTAPVTGSTTMNWAYPKGYVEAEWTTEP